MKDIHVLELELRQKLRLYEKEIALCNKSLRKRFPEDKSYKNDRYELERLINDVEESLFKLECFALREHTIRSMVDVMED